MSKWTHNICGECWIFQCIDENPERCLYDGPSAKDPQADAQIVGVLLPIRVTAAPLATCCFCGQQTRLGAFVRRDPAELKCKGEHA